MLGCVRKNNGRYPIHLVSESKQENECAVEGRILKIKYKSREGRILQFLFPWAPSASQRETSHTVSAPLVLARSHTHTHADTPPLSPPAGCVLLCACRELAGSTRTVLILFPLDLVSHPLPGPFPLWAIVPTILFHSSPSLSPVSLPLLLSRLPGAPPFAAPSLPGLCHHWQPFLDHLHPSNHRSAGAQHTPVSPFTTAPLFSLALHPLFSVSRPHFLKQRPPNNSTLPRFSRHPCSLLEPLCSVVATAAQDPPSHPTSPGRPAPFFGR